MLRLLQAISWPHARRHGVRSGLTFFGMALGIAVIVAIASVNRSLTGSFQSTIDQIAGKAVLQVANGDAGVAESMYPRIRDTEGVKDAAAAVEAFLPIAGLPGERLYIYGVDLLTDFAVRDHQFAGAEFGVEQALDFIAAPDSIAITESLSRRGDLPVGAQVALLTPRGKQTYTVRGLLKEQGAAKVFGGSFALMDLPVAQRALGKTGRLDIIDITVEDGYSIENVQARLRNNLGGAAEVERPKKRGEQVEQLLSSFRVGLFFVSLIALFVGFFLIYNTMSVSVIQRRREIGTLRCLGMRRSQLLRLILAEALLLATGAAITGTLLGWLLAQAALVAVGQTVANLFSAMDLAAAGLSWRDLALALASGVAVACLAALHPAWEAVQLSPLESARRALWRPGFLGKRSWATRLGFVCLGLAPIFIFIARGFVGSVQQFSVGIAGMLVFLLALAFLCPAFIHYGVRWFWRAALYLNRFFSFGWIEVRLASDNLQRNPLRSGISVATMIISLAAIFTIAAFVNSVRGSLLGWVDQMVTADLIVSSGARTAGTKNVPLSEEPLDALVSIPGVQIVDLYRLVRATYQGRPILIESFSAAESAAVRQLPMVQGDGARTLREMGAGAGVVISESFQSKFGKRAGDIIELATPSGAQKFEIIGVYVDYSSDIGSVLIDRALYKRFWRDDLVDAFDIWLDPGADERAVIQRIKGDYGDRYELFVSTHRELRQAVVKIMEQSFVVNYAVEIVAIVVAIFSVINTLLASVLDRTREIGVLRAIGATQSQIRRVVLLEAAWMGVLGGLLGLFAGTIMAYHHVVYNTKVLTGWTFQFYYPYDVALFSIFAAVLLCLAAGYGPAKSAASTPIVSAIGYE
ncbi:MAG TPA: FtsX-like permease family protein [Candidatus Binatia bacterium]|nr:FtsX-like permease family protein [Candidatus Binatia bacterium]